jgi:hypothetical protein
MEDEDDSDFEPGEEKEEEMVIAEFVAITKEQE